MLSAPFADPTSLNQFISSLFMGRLSDRFGRRPMLLLSLAGSVVGNFLQAIAWDMPSLIIFRCGGRNAGMRLVLSPLTPLSPSLGFRSSPPPPFPVCCVAGQ